MSLQFTNIHGDVLGSAEHLKGRASRHARKIKEPTSYHKGWRVIGIPPGAEDEAREMRSREIAIAEASGSAQVPAPFDAGNWRMNFKKKPVRSKPYELPDAANQCRELAERAGWQMVEVVEQKQVVQGVA